MRATQEAARAAGGRQAEPAGLARAARLPAGATAPEWRAPEGGLFRHSRWDALLAGLAIAQGGLLLASPSLPLIAFGVWWNSNTISHNFIHKPFFRSRALNSLFGLYLTVLLSIPQTLWRARHLAHHMGARHAGVPARSIARGRVALEISLVLCLWALLLTIAPSFFLLAYLPGWAAGLAIAWVHGHYEHARGTTSHYGRLYNWLFFQDGYHVEHHASPGTHWTRLAERRDPAASRSAWPAPLRWLEAFSLEGLERLALRFPFVQRWLVRSHRRAFERLLAGLPAPGRVGIVGGGLFPRTALALRQCSPEAKLTVIEKSERNLEAARAFLGGPLAGLELRRQKFTGGRDEPFDVLVIPLSFQGDRAALYREPPAPAVIVHDWIWRRRGRSVVISWMLLKRLNLVQGPGS